MSTAVTPRKEQEPPPPESVVEADPADFNIDLIARVEEQALHNRNVDERISDAISRTIGNLKFVLIHAVVLTAWMIINTGLLPGVQPFDPFPFGILTLIVSAEGIFLMIFVLISQNRMSKQADRRNHLDLQISMLAEQELTMILRLQQQLCRHHGIDVSKVEREAEKYTKDTNVQRMVEEIEQKLPEE